MDRIELRGLRAHGHHGVLADERRHGQPFVVDVTLERDLSAATASDALADTVDYASLAERVSGAVAASRFDLIEALAGHLAGLVLDTTDATAVTVRVAKPEAPIRVPFDEVAVVVRRARGGDAAGRGPA